MLVLALTLVALFGALLVVSSSDGHVHAGEAAVLSFDLSSVERAIEVLLCVVGVITVIQLLRPGSRWRAAAATAEHPTAPPRRIARRHAPALPELCRIQV